MDKAYLITKNNFAVEEVNFPLLRTKTNNIILEYIDELNTTYFKRSLFELYRLGFNVGILLKLSRKNDTKDYLIKFLNQIKGFKINLGVWVHIEKQNDYIYYDILDKYFFNNFITGVRDMYTNNSDMIPRWGANKDIEIINFEEILRDKIPVLSLNTDYKTIYDENKLYPIPTDVVIEALLV